MHAVHDDSAAVALRKAQQPPYERRGARGGAPTALHPLTLRLAAKQPADERRGPLPWIRGP
eukprot:6364864-Prymnesium_polylepis.1